MDSSVSFTGAAESQHRRQEDLRIGVNTLQISDDSSPPQQVAQQFARARAGGRGRGLLRFAADGNHPGAPRSPGNAWQPGQDDRNGGRHAGPDAPNYGGRMGADCANYGGRTGADVPRDLRHPGAEGRSSGGRMPRGRGRGNHRMPHTGRQTAGGDPRPPHHRNDENDLRSASGRSTGAPCPPNMPPSRPPVSRPNWLTDAKFLTTKPSTQLTGLKTGECVYLNKKRRRLWYFLNCLLIRVV